MGNITLNQIYLLIGSVVAIGGTLGAFYSLMKKAVNKIYEPVTEIKNEVIGLKEQVKIIKGGLCSSLRQSILKSSEDYLHKGYANLNQKEALSKALHDYQQNGGNSFVESIVKQVLELPNEEK